MFKCAIVEDDGQDFQRPRSEQLTLQVANQPLAPRQVLIIARFNTCSRLETLQFWKRWLKLRLWAAGFTKVTENSKNSRWKAPGFLNPGFSTEFDESIAMVRRLSSMARKLFTEVLASNAQFAAFESYCWPSRRWFSMALGSFSTLNHTSTCRTAAYSQKLHCLRTFPKPSQLIWSV